MKRILVLASIALSLCAAADTTIDEKAGPYDLRDAIGHPIGPSGVTLAECKAAAALKFLASGKPVEGYRCSMSVVVTVTGVCTIPKPAPRTDTVFDPLAVKYALDWKDGLYVGATDPNVEVTTAGVKYTFTDLGTLDPHLKAGSDAEYEFTLTDNVPAGYPGCWQIAPVAVSPVETRYYAPGYVPPLDAHALDGDKQR